MSGGSSDVSYTPGNFDPNDISAFSQDNASNKYTPDQVAMLEGAQQNNQNQTWYNKQLGIAGNGAQRDSSDVDISDLVSDFTAWKATQTTQADQYSAYVNMTQQQPGRDSTILGMQANPGTVLGGR